jgi:hypothetical protein
MRRPASPESVAEMCVKITGKPRDCNPWACLVYGRGWKGTADRVEEGPREKDQELRLASQSAAVG